VAFITALAMVFGPIRRLSAVHVTLQRGLAASEAIFSLLDRPSEGIEESTRRSGQSPVRGGLRFEEVSFVYPHQAKPSLKDVSFEIKPGESVALIGPSGAGKSTVLNLIAGFYSPSSGRILLDDKPYEQWGVDSIRSQISFVGQNIVLFDASIAENILMGSPDEPREKVVWAAQRAHALEFIEQLPDGFDSPMGSLGGRLSGGQRQRIAIARAFLKDAPILLLDEPTSALDRESEMAVNRGIEALMMGRTVIWVSHSPENLFGIDRTIAL